MGSAIRIFLVTPLLGLLAAVGLLLSQGEASADSWQIVAVCDENGYVVGEIDVPVAGSFDIYVTDHVPEEGFWVEVPGSRQTITVVVGKEGRLVSYGPLDISQIRLGANSIRVEQTASPEKSESFKPCSKAATPTKSATAVATSTKTPGPTATRTSESHRPRRTPTATSTRVIETSSTQQAPSSTKTPVIQLPRTGTGNDGPRYTRGEATFAAVGSIIVFLIMTGVAGGLVYLQLNHPHK